MKYLFIILVAILIGCEEENEVGIKVDTCVPVQSIDDQSKCFSLCPRNRYSSLTNVRHMNCPPKEKDNESLRHKADIP